MDGKTYYFDPIFGTLTKGAANIDGVDHFFNEETGIQVYIGSENQLPSLQDCSIVTATYELEEGGTGTVGIIGPKRMDYRKVVHTLKNLTADLDEIFNKKS